MPEDDHLVWSKGTSSDEIYEAHHSPAGINRVQKDAPGRAKSLMASTPGGQAGLVISLDEKARPLESLA